MFPLQKGMLSYQKFCASLSVPSETSIEHFHVPELLPKQQETLPPDLRFHPLAWLLMHSSHSQLHSADPRCDEGKEDDTCMLNSISIDTIKDPEVNHTNKRR